MNRKDVSSFEMDKQYYCWPVVRRVEGHILGKWQTTPTSFHQKKQSLNEAFKHVCFFWNEGSDWSRAKKLSNSKQIFHGQLNLILFQLWPKLDKLDTYIFNEFSLCVSKNGFSSEYFTIGRGCRQGDPASPYIFLLCVEIMGAMIRNDEQIKGITINEHEYKLLQYADDTALLLDGQENSLRRALSLID